MSREIKFRVWNPNANKFVAYSGVNEMPLHEAGALVLKVPVYEVLQYTGLKDKNGVEIYEGDIILFGHPRKTFLPLEDATRKAPVVYRYGSFNVAGNTLGEVTDWHECEVIGNIHENPGLVA